MVTAIYYVTELLAKKKKKKSELQLWVNMLKFKY